MFYKIFYKITAPPTITFTYTMTALIQELYVSLETVASYTLGTVSNGIDAI